MCLDGSDEPMLLTLKGPSEPSPASASMTLNQAKSFSDRLFSIATLFCVHADLFHFSTTCSFPTTFLTTPDPAARGRPVNFSGVRVRHQVLIRVRGTPVVGPSIIACASINGTNNDTKSYKTYPIVVNTDSDFVNVCTRPKEDDFEYANSV